MASVVAAALVSPDRGDEKSLEYSFNTIEDDESLKGGNIGLDIGGHPNNDDGDDEGEGSSMNITTVSAPTPQTTRTVSPPRRRFLSKLQRNKEKAACEYYNEEAYLEDGDLPSLSTPAISNAKARVVTPPKQRRSITPVQDNTEETTKKRFQQKKKEEKMKQKKKKNSNAEDEAESEVITITAPKLSVEDKRKHRAFWNQFDLKDEEYDNESGSGTDGSDIAPRDEMGKSTGRNYSQRKDEVLVDEEEEADNRGIYDMVMGLCADCGWMGDHQRESDKKKEKDRPQRSRSSGRGDQDITSRHSKHEDDEEKEYNKTSRRHEKKAKAFVSPNSVLYDNREVLHDYDDVEEQSNSVTDEEERYASIKQRQRGDENPVDYVVPLKESSTTEKVDEPQNYENTKIEIEYNGEEDDPRFLQLNTSGDVSVYSRPGETKKPMNHNATPVSRRIPSMNRDPMPSDEKSTQINVEDDRGGYILAKSKSWSAPQKNQYLQAMALKAKADFNKTKATNSYGSKNLGSDLSDEDDSLDDVLNKRTYQKKSRAIDWTKQSWTPSEKRRLFHLVKSEGKTPEEATDIIIGMRIKQTIEEQESKGSYGSAEPGPVPMRRAATFHTGSSSIFDRSHDTRQTIDDSAILSNLSNKPGFTRAIDSNAHDHLIHASESTASGSRPILPSHKKESNDDKKKTSSNAHLPIAAPTGRKKGSRFGHRWHEINDDDYNSDEESYKQLNANSEVRYNEETPNEEDDIFDFQAPSPNEGGPLDTIKLDPYHDSCEVSYMGSAVGGDQTVMSSGRSIYTTATNSSAWSTSTRRRHRGAAKNRSGKRREKPVGWMESIKAAAESSHHQWDPEVGWVGYVEKPEEVEVIKHDTSRIGRLKPLKSPVTSKGFIAQTSHKQQNAPGIAFPSEWEVERDEMISDADDGGASAVTEVVRNVERSNNYDDVQSEVASNAETEIVSNTVGNFIDKVTHDIIPETIREAISENDEPEENDNDSEKHYEQEEGKNRGFESLSDERHEIQILRNDVSHVDKPQSAAAFVQNMESETMIAPPSDNENSRSPVNRGDKDFCEISDDNALNVETLEKSQANYTAKEEGHMNTIEEVENDIDEESDDVDEDGEDFKNNMSSFDFLDNDNNESYLEEDGFKIIDHVEAPPTTRAQVEEKEQYDDEKSTVSVKSSLSVTSLMSTRAKEWRKKVETGKRSHSSQRGRADTEVEVTAANDGNIFVSAVDDNSTFEFRENPKVLNVDENDTLFDFGGVSKEVRTKMVEESVRSRKLRDKRPPSNSRKARVVDEERSIDDEMSEITTPTVGMNGPGGTFFDRLQSCSAVAVSGCKPVNGDNGLPTAHLNFLRNVSAPSNPSSQSQDNRTGGLIEMLRSSSGCLGQEIIEEPEEKFENPKIKTKRGGKYTANYLDAIQKSCKTPSVASSGSTQSETWQRFLDKRAVALSSKRSSTSDVSKAAQEYASKKVSDIVSKVSSEGKPRQANSTLPPRTKPHSIRRINSRGEVMSRSEAAKAAEDLAAARVEAMMAMTPRSASQDECEI